MRNPAAHMTPGARFRIILLLLLSLVSAMPDVFPDGGGHRTVRVPESIHHENEIPEACKVSLRLEAATRQQRQHKKQQSFRKSAAVQLYAAGETRQAGGSWTRPAYYNFLHRFSLF